MSVTLMGKIFYADLPSTEKLAMLAIADKCSDDGHGARQAVGTLARKCSLSRRGLQKVLARLETAGWLVPVSHVTGGGRNPVEYRVNFGGKGELGSLFRVHRGRTRRPRGANPETARGGRGSPNTLRNAKSNPLLDFSAGRNSQERAQPTSVENHAHDLPPTGGTEQEPKAPLSAERLGIPGVAAAGKFPPNRADLEQAIFRRAVSSALHDSWLRSSADDVHAFQDGIKVAAAAAADSLLENRRASLGGIRTELLARAGIAHLARHTQTLFAVSDFTRRVQAATAAIVAAVAGAAIELLPGSTPGAGSER